MKDYPEETDACLDKSCKGKYVMTYPDISCSCHINPPCGRCEASYLTCSICGCTPEEAEEIRVDNECASWHTS